MSSRNSNIDCLRFVLMLFVVQFHMNPYEGNMSLYRLFNVELVVWLFMVLSLYLFQLRGAHLAKVKWSRLLAPYLFWSVAYLCLRSMKSLMLGTDLQLDMWSLRTFLGGGAAVHLYFIPLLVVYQLSACLSVGLFQSRGDWQRWVTSLMVLSVFAISSYLWSFKSPVIGGAYGMFFDAFLAVLYAQVLVVSIRVGVVRSGVFYATTGLFLLLLFYLQSALIFSVYFTMLVASLLIYFLLSLPQYPPIQKLNWFYSTSFGLFLSHHAIIEILEVFSAKFGFNLIPYALITRLLLTLVVFLIACLIIVIVRKSKVASLVVLGERSAN